MCLTYSGEDTVLWAEDRIKIKEKNRHRDVQMRDCLYTESSQANKAMKNTSEEEEEEYLVGAERTLV